MYKNIIKRFLDFILALIGAVVLLPVFAIIAICIKCNSKGPVLFKQERVGKNKVNFKILKFRTMFANTPKDVPTHLLKNPEASITKVGKFLRKTSLDELPQIFNILSGKMSIIGPRPALYNQYDLIDERDIYGANSLAPGLTGYAQINGRDEIPIKLKAQYDGFYTKNISFKLDVIIFVKTIANVFIAKGVKEGENSENL